MFCTPLILGPLVGGCGLLLLLLIITTVYCNSESTREHKYSTDFYVQTINSQAVVLNVVYLFSPSFDMYLIDFAVMVVRNQMSKQHFLHLL